jgi:S-DNA-T family DNA segregation ATPase FtsK/SpoIIIE
MDYIRANSSADYVFRIDDLKDNSAKPIDEEVKEAAQHVVLFAQASTNSLMKKFNWGYDKATKVIEILEAKKIIGPANGTKPRDILVTIEEVQNILS